MIRAVTQVLKSDNEKRLDIHVLWSFNASHRAQP